MALKKGKRRRKEEERNFFYCYNCDLQIIDSTQQTCPNCQVLLNPNDAMKWRRSFYCFLCTLCVIPILIAVLITFF
ncbi:MAG: hypothetical protein ACTSU4_07085 [Promethearchaeota archaeon]